MSRPLAIDLFCGLGGWTEGLLAEGFDVIGFDIEAHRYPARDLSAKDGVKVGLEGVDFNNPKGGSSVNRSFNYANEIALRNAPLTGGWIEYPAQLVIQDVRTLHGAQFRNAALIVASPPCQGYSYRAMPWKRAKALPPPDNELFKTCFRIQREASDAAGRHIPLVVENVRGAQKWVGPARWNFGSFYLWGDVPAPVPQAQVAQKFNPDGTSHGQGSWFAVADSRKIAGSKNNGGSWFAVAHNTTSGKGQNPDGRKLPGVEGVKHHSSGAVRFDTGPASLPSSSPAPQDGERDDRENSPAAVSTYRSGLPRQSEHERGRRPRGLPAGALRLARRVQDPCRARDAEA